jgi:hypothetical protein
VQHKSQSRAKLDKRRCGRPAASALTGREGGALPLAAVGVGGDLVVQRGPGGPVLVQHRATASPPPPRLAACCSCSLVQRAGIPRLGRLRVLLLRLRACWAVARVQAARAAICGGACQALLSAQRLAVAGAVQQEDAGAVVGGQDQQAAPAAVQLQRGDLAAAAQLHTCVRPCGGRAVPRSKKPRRGVVKLAV